MHRRIVQWVVGVLIVVVLLYIYFLGSQLRYESEAERFFKEGRFDLAAEKYLRAYEVASFWGRDRYLYLVAQCYYNTEDWNRAMDFFIRLHREYPFSSWVIVAQPAVDRTFRKIDPDLDGGAEMVKAHTALARAQAALKGAYRSLLTALKENKPGVSTAVEAEYQRYKKYYEAYRYEKRRIWLAAQAGADIETVGAPQPLTLPGISPQKEGSK